MSKNSEKYAWLNTRENSAKTIVAEAKLEVPGFEAHYAKFKEQTVIGGYAARTLFNYSSAVAKISLHFKKSIVDLDADEVNHFLFLMAKEKGANSTYFKHSVYGLRFFFRLYDLEDRVIKKVIDSLGIWKYTSTAMLKINQKQYKMLLKPTALSAAEMHRLVARRKKCNVNHTSTPLSSSTSTPLSTSHIDEAQHK
jgi:hypothetical protein